MKKEEKYSEGIGRRKTATCRVRIYENGSGFLINDKDVNDYFKTDAQRSSAAQPFSKIALANNFKVSAKVSGSGLSAQAEAVSLGLARALVKYDSSLSLGLKNSGLLTRDSRMVERKKPGLKKARRAPQWAKR